MAVKTNELVLNSVVNPRRIEVLQMPGGDSLTRQEFVDECDINLIMSRYERGGAVPWNEVSAPQYLDLTLAPSDLMYAMNTMIDAENAFMSLPANVRKEFDNDAMRFVEYASNPDNIVRMREWRLAPEPTPEAPPTRVEVVNPVVPPSPKA